MARGPKQDLAKPLRNVLQHPTAKNVPVVQPTEGPNATHIATARKLRPKTLTKDERKLWDGTAPQMVMLGRLKPHFVPAYEEYCVVVIRMRDTRKFLNDNDWTYSTMTRNGLQHKSRPEVGQLNDDWRKWRTLVGEFGLAPAAERGMKQGPQGDMFGDGWDDL
jgi:phage terminase small subunit